MYFLLGKDHSNYLQYNLGWKKILSGSSLKPGDIVFTKDHKRHPGYPAHTYMFAGWSNKRKSAGYVVDNRKFMYVRNIVGNAGGGYTPFRYALRAPE